jgi:predicted lipoprotein with Yx(FWY)xxD motif
MNRSSARCVSINIQPTPKETRPMKSTTLRMLSLSIAAGASLALSSCGSSTKTAAVAPAAAEAPVSSEAPATSSATKPAAGATVALKAASSSLGQILVDAQGRTLYAFTNDINAQSTCTGTCAEAWPPQIVDESWTVAPGLDSGIFSTSARTDGTLQLMAGKFPLYYFSGDAKPGDVNGQGSGGVWFAVAPNATTVAGTAAGAPTTAEAAPTTAAASPTTTVYGKAAVVPTTVTPAPASAAPPIVEVADNALGSIVVDGKGRTLYAFTKDVDGTSTCVDGCAKAWPAVVVSGDIAVGDGLDKTQFSTVTRADGSKQLKLGKWPLYYFSGDAAAGETNCQGSGGSWFVIGKDAKLIKGS